MSDVLFLAWRYLAYHRWKTGILVAAKALLEKNPDPTETETRYWLAGNLCRCTGYDKIVRAVLDAAAEMRAAAEKGAGKKSKSGKRPEPASA